MQQFVTRFTLDGGDCRWDTDQKLERHHRSRDLYGNNRRQS